MKTTIVFFDTVENSSKGLSRALIIFPILTILYVVWNLSIKYSIYRQSSNKISRIRKIVVLFLMLTLLVSAIGTQIPETSKNAATYGALVGLVTHSSLNAGLLVQNQDWKLWYASLDILFGTGAASLSSFILYNIVKADNNRLQGN
jgi:uncharacterized membrane protein